MPFGGPQTLRAVGNHICVRAPRRSNTNVEAAAVSYGGVGEKKRARCADARTSAAKIDRNVGTDAGRRIFVGRRRGRTTRCCGKTHRIAPTIGHGACCNPVDSEVALLPHLRSANLLLIGPDAATREFLAPLMASLPSPVVFCNGAEPAFPDGPVGSLIVRDVGRLTRTHQQQLLEWLNDRSRSARVIATSAEQVFPDVTRGVFSDGLYYRLNTVTLLLNRRDPQKGQEYSPAPAQRSRAMPQADFVKK